MVILGVSVNNVTNADCAISYSLGINNNAICVTIIKPIQEHSENNIPYFAVLIL